jgi:N-acetylmuramic acid 6-phosphate etherase
MELRFERNDEMNINLSELTTEQVNNRTKKIDQMSTIEVLKLINDEDRTVADAVRIALPQIEAAIDSIYKALKSGGRLIYIGAGTSGRLGVVDASECPPTFRTSPDLVQAIMAGGEQAMYSAAEGAEDDPGQGENDLKQRQLTERDVVVGIAASGRTPYVAGALIYAKKLGAATVALSCNRDAVISRNADHPIEVIVGAEILTGSTRLKAATAQKMVLNMITTTTMIKLGKVYENLMVDLHANNQKLIERARRIVMLVTGASYDTAEQALNETNQEVKPAIVIIKTGVSLEMAREAIEQANGFVRQAIELAIAKKGA